MHLHYLGYYIFRHFVCAEGFSAIYFIRTTIYYSRCAAIVMAHVQG